MLIFADNSIIINLIRITCRGAEIQPFPSASIDNAILLTYVDVKPVVSIVVSVDQHVIRGGY